MAEKRPKFTLEQMREIGKDKGIEIFSAAVLPETLNDEERTVEVTWLNDGLSVPRMDWWTGKPYLLELDPNGVELARLNAGGPVLDSHMDIVLSNQVGVVVNGSAFFDKKDGQYKAKLKISRRPDVDGVWMDIKDGIIQNLSVGFSIKEKLEVTKESDKWQRFKATKWEPHEISLVSVPADFGTALLHAENVVEPATTLNEETIGASLPTQEEESTMNEQLNNVGAAAEATPNPTPVAAPTVDTVALTNQAVAAERLRSNTIRQRVKVAGLGEELAQQLIDNGVTAEAASEQIFAALASKAPATDSRVSVERDETDTFRQSVANQLLHRFKPDTYKLEGKAREFVGMSLMELGRECVVKMGKNPRGMNRDEVAKFALHSTSDFPNILADVANKTLRDAYTLAGRTFLPLGRRTTLSDFKQVNRMLLGEAPQLVKVNESGEIKRGTMTDSKSAYGLASYARIIGLTRKTIINDDLDAFTRIPQGFGFQAANLESDIFWGVVTANAAMGDGVAIFHATHKNLAGSGGAIGVDTVGDARASMRKQTGLDGKSVLNIQPKYLVVPVALETKTEQFISANVLPVTIATSVPQSLRSLNPISEPRLDANSTTAWYLFADPNAIDTIEYAYLEGAEGLITDTRAGFDVDGVEIKVLHDFGCGVIDFRGMYKNIGA